jgi:hypothetical protein
MLLDGGEASVEDRVCGRGSSYCRQDFETKYLNSASMDKCALRAATALNDSVSDYIMWLPKYRTAGQCEASGYLSCGGPEGNRMAPRKIQQESVLQGRGQLLGPRKCPGSQVKYLPPEGDVFAPQGSSSGAPKRCPDMTLYSRPTRLPKSCGSISEVDMNRRYEPLPQAFQGTYAPLTLGLPAPTINRPGSRMPAAPAAYYGAGSQRRTEGHTLENKSYPTWDSLKRQQEAHLQG